MSSIEVTGFGAKLAAAAGASWRDDAVPAAFAFAFLAFPWLRFLDDGISIEGCGHSCAIQLKTSAGGGKLHVALLTPITQRISVVVAFQFV